MTQCLRDFFVTMIDNNNYEKITCPDHTCKQIPIRNEIETILGGKETEAFKKYEIIERNLKVAKSKETLK